MTTEREKFISELRAGWIVDDDEDGELPRLDRLCWQAADMLDADSDLRTQLAQRTVERDMAIKMAADGAQGEPVITLPRELDEDLYYIVGSAMGAESPEQCGRAAELWEKLVRRSDSDAKFKAMLAKGGAM